MRSVGWRRGGGWRARGGGWRALDGGEAEDDERWMEARRRMASVGWRRGGGWRALDGDRAEDDERWNLLLSQHRCSIGNRGIDEQGTREEFGTHQVAGHAAVRE
eukprot:1195270-Prorocentrum_minimum.AAC.2